jgi:hypothetical protein
MRFGIELAQLCSLTAWTLVGVASCAYLFGTAGAGLLGGLAAALLWKRYRVEPRVVVRWPGWFELECYWFVRRREGEGPSS